MPGKNPWNDAVVRSLFFLCFDVSECGCASGSSVFKYALYSREPVHHVYDLGNIVDHCFWGFLVYILIFLSRSFESSTGLGCDKSYSVWGDFLHPIVFLFIRNYYLCSNAVSPSVCHLQIFFIIFVIPRYLLFSYLLNIFL